LDHGHARRAALGLTEEQRRKVIGENASKIYGLAAPAVA
jgi:predicted TIM-barrel fold metal-dependent hydrolase